MGFKAISKALEIARSTEESIRIIYKLFSYQRMKVFEQFHFSFNMYFLSPHIYLFIYTVSRVFIIHLFILKRFLLYPRSSDRCFSHVTNKSVSLTHKVFSNSELMSWNFHMMMILCVSLCIMQNFKIQIYLRTGLILVPGCNYIFYSYFLYKLDEISSF